MKHRTFVASLAALAVLTLVWVMWPAAKLRSSERADPLSASAEVTEDPGSLETLSSASQSGNPFSRRTAGGARRATHPPGDLRVNAALALAMVNQTPVQLRDLMPVRPGETESELTPEQYESRLQRAIEMELTFQAARVQGVALTVAQQRRLDQVGVRHQAELERYRNYGLSWSSFSPEQVEFEKRLLAAQMLEQNLLARKAAVTPSPEREMQARYEQARRELLDQLESSANITMAVPAL